MKTVSQRFSTKAGFKPVLRNFVKIGPRTFREPRACADELTFEAFHIF